MYARGRGFDYVAAVKIIKKYNISQNILICGWLALIVEIITRHLKPKYKEKEIFDLLINLFEILDKTKDQEKSLNIITASIFSLVNILGFCPELSFCQECQAEIKPEDNYFSPGFGGLLCPACQKADGQALKVSPDAIKIMRFFLKNEFSRAAALRLKKENLEELKKALFVYLPYILEDEFKSLKFIEKATATT